MGSGTDNFHAGIAPWRVSGGWAGEYQRHDLNTSRRWAPDTPQYDQYLWLVELLKRARI
jgi:hypothetical protein